MQRQEFGDCGGNDEECAAPKAEITHHQFISQPRPYYWTGKWKVPASWGNIMELEQHDDIVTGWWVTPNSNHTIHGKVNNNHLVGTWTSGEHDTRPPAVRAIIITLSDDGMTFNGTYGIDNKTWSGTRIKI
jgi:hypothetical protein